MRHEQSTLVGLMWILATSSALAELPDQSILTRYGITSEQLPVAQADSPVEVVSRPRFEVKPEKPWVSVSLGKSRKPQMTGNISIDHSNQQAYERCLRLQEESLRRKGGWVSCEQSSATPEGVTDFNR